MMHIYFYSLQCVQLIWFGFFFAGRSPTTSNFTQGSYRDLNSWKSLYPAIFQTWKKVWKREMKSGKTVKSLEFLFLQSYNKRFISEFFFVLVSSYSISPLRLVGNVLLRMYVLLCCACTLLENRQYLEWWTFLNMNQNYYGLFKQ